MRGGSLFRVTSAARVLALGLVTALLASSCGGGAAPRAPAPAAIGGPAPGFALSDQHGRTYSLADYSGQKVLLVFYMGYF